MDTYQQIFGTAQTFTVNPSYTPSTITVKDVIAMLVLHAMFSNPHYATHSVQEIVQRAKEAADAAALSL